MIRKRGVIDGPFGEIHVQHTPEGYICQVLGMSPGLVINAAMNWVHFDKYEIPVMVILGIPGGLALRAFTHEMVYCIKPGCETKSPPSHVAEALNTYYQNSAYAQMTPEEYLVKMIGES